MRVGEDLLDQLAAPFGRRKEVSRVAPAPLVLRLVEQHLAVGDDPMQHVVEVVHDPAREAAGSAGCAAIVSVKPGATELTRTPCGPTSFASPLL